METLKGPIKDGLDVAMEFCYESNVIPHRHLQMGMSLPKAACSHRSTEHLVWECGQPG